MAGATPAVLAGLALLCAAGAQSTPYDGAPPAWQEVHAALLVRTGPDGRTYGTDRTDPLLWANTEHLLRGASHARALAALDSLLEDPLDESSVPVLLRVLLQRDLWAVFDWVASPWADDPVDARRALAGRLARAIVRLAPTAAELATLPDGHALGSRRAEREPDGDFAEAWPHGLLDPGGDWVCLDRIGHRPIASLHTAAFPRSTFAVFVRLPGGREATLEYLESLDRLPIRLPQPGEPARPNPAMPQFPLGTTWVLLRRAIALDAALRPVPTAIVEALQVRTYLEIPAGAVLTHDHPERTQRFAAFELDRRDLLAGGPGLRALAADDADFHFVQFQSHGYDPFDGPGFSPPSLAAVETCGTCHRDPGIHSVLAVAPNSAGPAFADVRPGELETAVARSLVELRRSHAFGRLLGHAGR